MVVINTANTRGSLKEDSGREDQRTNKMLFKKHLSSRVLLKPAHFPPKQSTPRLHSEVLPLLSHLKLYLTQSWQRTLVHVGLPQQRSTSQFRLSQNYILGKATCLESHRQPLRSSLCRNSSFSISNVFCGMLYYPQKTSLKNLLIPFLTFWRA